MPQDEASVLTDPPASMQCHWAGCLETSSFANSIILFDHITQCHIGRKASNNLCLTCHWDNCRFQAKKRDHITSHMRSHIDYRPHLCPLCQKSFKRPQDLKKHERTHMDTPAATATSTGLAGHKHHPLTLSPESAALSPEYYALYPNGASSPNSAYTNYLSVSSPNPFPDSPSSMHGFVPELSPDTSIPSTGFTGSYANSDVSDNEGGHTKPSRGLKRGNPFDELLDTDQRVKVATTYNQDTRNILERLIAQNAVDLVGADNTNQLGMDSLQQLYHFFEEVYQQAASVNVAEALETPAAHNLIQGGGDLAIEFDSSSTVGVVPSLPLASGVPHFDITVQPFDEAAYQSAYSGDTSLPMSAGMSAALLQQQAAAFIYPGSAGLSQVPLNYSIGPTTTPISTMPGTPMGYNGMMGTAIPKGFIQQAVPVAEIAQFQQPAYQFYTMQPQMKAREDSLDPEIVDQVFGEVIDDKQVMEPAPKTTCPSSPAAPPSPLPTPTPALTPASPPTEDVPAGDSVHAESPSSTAELEPRSPKALSQRLVKSVLVCSPSLVDKKSPLTASNPTPPTATRTFMYPCRPYNKKISMTEHPGDEEDYVDISLQTNRARIGAKASPAKALVSPSAAAVQPSEANRHAELAARVLACLQNLMAQRAQSTDAAAGSNAADDDDYIKLEKADCIHSETIPTSPKENLRQLLHGKSRSTDRAGFSPTSSLKDDLISRFQKLSTAATPSSSPPALSAFDITVLPDDAD